MDQSKKINSQNHGGQFNYLGRWVDKSTFRAFVYDKNGEQKLAGSYQVFEELTGSGIYFASKPEPEAFKEPEAPAPIPMDRKNKNGTIRAKRN